MERRRDDLLARGGGGSPAPSSPSAPSGRVVSRLGAVSSLLVHQLPHSALEPTIATDGERREGTGIE